MNHEHSLSAPDSLPSKILLIRSRRVILDSDLARLYEVPTKALNQAVRRNPGRFPDDFMFQLSDDEFAALRSQTVTLKPGRGQHRKYLPYAFTEHGCLMAATVLNAQRAIDMSVFIVRAFVQQRALLLAQEELVARLDVLEMKYDGKFKSVFAEIRRLSESQKVAGADEASQKRRPIGFTTRLDGETVEKK